VSAFRSSSPYADAELRGLIRQLSSVAAVLDIVSDPDARHWLSWKEREERRRQRAREARRRLRELRDILATMRLDG
jgi:hypothetical protein